MKDALSNWLAEEGITLSVSDDFVFTDPAIYIIDEENSDLTRVLVRVTGETVEDFAAQISGHQVVANRRVIQCPKNWGENYDFSEEGLT